MFNNKFSQVSVSFDLWAIVGANDLKFDWSPARVSSSDKIWEGGGKCDK